MSTTPFTVYGRPRVVPTMSFPAGTKYETAVAAFEAAHPDFAFGHAVSLVGDEFDDMEEAEGEFCDACGHFVSEDAERGADAEDMTICGPCMALHREHSVGVSRR
jgi:hypothetical protein